MQWARHDGGTVFICDSIVSSETYVGGGSAEPMTGILLIYDVIGNLVYQRSNEDDLVPPYQRNRWTPGESRRLVFYWNCITDGGRKPSPGVNRVNLFLKQGGRLQKYRGNIGVTR